MCETSQKCEAYYFDLVKTLNSTHFNASKPLRAAFEPLNNTMNDIHIDEMTVQELATFSSFQMQLMAIFDSTVMYIERYSLAMFGQLSNTPISMFMQQFSSQNSMYLSMLGIALERNPTCTRPLFPKWIPSLQIVQDTCMEIVESSIENIPETYESTFEAVDEAVSFLESVNSQFGSCTDTVSVGECISAWITSSFQCITCSPFYTSLENVLRNHSMSVNNVTMSTHMKINGMHSLTESNEVKQAIQTCASAQM
ncbi:unnamed protein product [Diamesa serratosioi]